MPKITGGCLCGAVRYTIGSDPVMVRNCHCDDCRRVTGCAFATNVFVKNDDITILSGELKRFDHEADSGNPRMQEFCPQCGASVFSKGAMKGIKAVRIGTLDDASGLSPSANLFTARALEFSHIDGSLENSLGMPE